MNQVVNTPRRLGCRLLNLTLNRRAESKSETQSRFMVPTHACEKTKARCSSGDGSTPR